MNRKLCNKKKREHFVWKRVPQEQDIFRDAFTIQQLNVSCLMKCSFFCHCCPQSWEMKLSHPYAKEASSWAIIHLWLWVIGSHFFALQCPSLLLSTSVSLPTHYIQVLDNTWVSCDIQMADFPPFREFSALTLHTYMKFRSVLFSMWKLDREVSIRSIFVFKSTSKILYEIMQ